MAGTFTDTFGTGPKVYIGARSDVGTAMNTAPCWTGKKRGEGCLVMLLTPLCVIDLVPSLAMDTIFLPFTITHDTFDDRQK